MLGKRDGCPADLESQITEHKGYPKSQNFELLFSDLIYNADLIFQLSISDLSCILFSNLPETNVERGEREEECEGVVGGEGERGGVGGYDRE